MTFPRINKQARGIAALYKWFGLYSIPLLTIVTIISISNVFTRGQLASGSLIETAWAIIFATAIEVNIVRLFFEWKMDKDTGALCLGIGLVLVAGVALLIEGLQQSIGFTWSNLYVQIVVGIVVGLRVFVVVLLLAREGSRLASAMITTEQEEVTQVFACPVHFSEPLSEQQVLTPSEQEPITEPIITVNTLPITEPNITVFTGKHQTPAEKRVYKVLKSNPDASLTVIASKAQVSRGYASQVRTQWRQKQLAKEA